MYSSSPLDIGQQAPVTGIPVAPTNQQYPTQRYTPTAVKVPWSTGLYDCTADVPNCCLTCWCPCITFGHIADIVSQGSISCRASGAFFVLLSILTVCISNRIYSYTYRARLRSQYILEESPCRDCYLHFWCEACALCQEFRELKNRGFDVSLGWHGNWERQKILGVPMPMPMPMPMAPAEMETGMRR